MANLKTNYKDDVLDTSKNEKRKFMMIQNEDGTVSFEDVTEYTQVGDTFGAADINKTNEGINALNEGIKRVYGYHASGESLTLNNVAKGSIIFIKGSGNNNYYLGFIDYDGYVTTMLSNGYDNIPTYDINSKKLTLMTSGYYHYIII